MYGLKCMAQMYVLKFMVTNVWLQIYYFKFMAKILGSQMYGFKCLITNI